VTQVNATAVTYDANGNLTDDGIRLCYYDAFNRLKEVFRRSDGLQVAQYVYDALGRRIRKVVSEGGLSGAIPDGTTDYLYADQQCVEERNGSNAVTKQFVWGVYIDELIQLKTYVPSGQQSLSAGVYWPMQDLHYRVTALSDASKAIVEIYDHDPYGRHLAFAGPGMDGVWFSDDDVVAAYAACQHGHQGLLHNEESGLVYNRARMLHPTLGRFLQRDPLPPTWLSEQTNLYQYVRGEPSIGRDPSGLATEWDNALAECDQKYNECVAKGGLFDWWGRAVCSVEWKDCYLRVLPSFDPLGDASPECDKYKCDDTYAGANAKCFCKCAGNSDWSKFVRGCLRMMYDEGFDPAAAHTKCYALADIKHAKDGRPWGTLTWCYAKCVI